MPPRRTTSKPAPPPAAGNPSAGSSSSHQARPRSDTIRATPAQTAAASSQLASAGGSRPSQAPQPEPPSRSTTPQPRQPGLSGADSAAGVDQPQLNDGELNLASDKTTPRKATGGSQVVTPKDVVWVKNANDSMDEFYAEVKDFLESVLQVPLVKDPEGRTVKACWKKCKELLSTAETDNEHVLYGIVAEAVNEMFKALGWGYFLAITAFRPQDNINDRKPDLILYRSSKPGERDRNALYYTSRLEDSNDPYAAQTAWAEAVAVAEVKVKPEAAPFNFDNKPLEVLLKGRPLPAGDVKDARHTRAQMISYVTDVHLHQHRRFLYTAFLQREHVRFMRWDRSGAIVSRSYDWQKNPEVLLRFFLRLASCTPEERGEDTSVESVEKVTARDLVRNIMKDSERYNTRGSLRAYITRALKDQYHPLVKVQCRDIHDHAVTRTYYIARYRAGSHSARGRGTKGYIGFDLESDPDSVRVVFIKDFWYPEGTRTELMNYQLLHEKQVPHIATVLAGGDVGGGTPQTTVNQDFFPADRRPSKRVHIRIVMAEVGRRLETYKDQMELLKCTNHAFQAHKFAYERAGLLHRDVSADNIMINIMEGTDGFGQGFLNDWDLARLVGAEDPLTTITPSDRSGTWPYMSAPLLIYPRKPNHLSDDLESFVHILQIFGLRFHWHSCSPPEGFTEEENETNDDLAALVRDTYYQSHRKYGYWVGSRWKYKNMLNGTPLVKFRNAGPADNSGPLPALLNAWYNAFYKHYQTLKEFEEFWDELWGPHKSSTPPSATVKQGAMSCTLLRMTHAEMEDALSEALRFKLPLHEHAAKTPDQFVGLPSADGTAFTRPSTGGGSSRTLSTQPIKD